MGAGGILERETDPVSFRQWKDSGSLIPGKMEQPTSPFRNLPIRIAQVSNKI
ncbi:hypothetical protein [Membranihabitans maritimus]|uniref:hypothetical protein n=1 Tax=Membranihabitans maritimus TaxID=2904244 RepID=UPI001F478200|nr:hypothetical protein [Membranihabitans maritimus]